MDGMLTGAYSQTLLALCAKLDDTNKQRMLAAGLALRIIKITFGTVAIALIFISFLWKVYHFSDVLIAIPIVAMIYITSEIAKASILSPIIANRDYFQYSLWITIEAANILIATSVSMMLFTALASTYLLGFVLAKVITTLLLILAKSRGYYLMNIDFDEVRRAEKEAFNHGWPISLMAPLGWAALYLDRYILAAVGGATLTGVYSAGVALASRPYTLTTSVLTSYFRPKLYRSGFGQATNSIRWSTQNTWIATAFAIGMFGTVTFYFLGGAIASMILGGKFRSDITFLLLFLCLAQTFTIMTHAIDNALLASGASTVLLRTQFVLLSTTMLLIPLISCFGARGAVIGRLAAEVVKFAWTFLVAYRLTDPRTPGSNVVV